MITRRELLDILSIAGAKIMLDQNYVRTEWWAIYNGENATEEGPTSVRVNPGSARSCIDRGEVVWNRELSEWPIMIFTPRKEEVA